MTLEQCVVSAMVYVAHLAIPALALLGAGVMIVKGIRRAF